MDAFDYAAVDETGRRMRGTVMAASARDARTELRARALIPVEITPAQTKTEAAIFGRNKKVSHLDLTQASRQLAILIKADNSVEQALKITALQFKKSPLRAKLLDVRAQVLEGKKLSDALLVFPDVFSPLYIAMVSAGETSGHLDRVLNRVATDMEAAQKIRRKVMAATVYPVVLCFVALSVVVVLMVFVVPKIVVQFESFGQDLPALTRFTIGASNWIVSYGLIAVALASIGNFIFIRALRREKVRRYVDGYLLKTPFLGRLIRVQNAARYARTVGGLLESGTPALSALEAAQSTLQNKPMAEAAMQAAIKIRGGSAVGSALGASEIFPDILVHMVSGGEASGDLGQMFVISADYLEGELDSAISIFLSLLEPIIIIVLAGIVLLIIAAIFLPILQLNTLAF